MHQHEFSDKELFDGYCQANLEMNNEHARRQKMVDEWTDRIRIRVAALKGLVLINKFDKREYQIRRLWPSSEYELEVIELKPRKQSAHVIYEAHLYEFTVTTRKVTT